MEKSIKYNDRCSKIRTVKEGYLCLLSEAKMRALDDMGYYESGSPPPGNCGYTKSKGGKLYKNILTYDPVKEYYDSRLYQIGKEYYNKVGK